MLLLLSLLQGGDDRERHGGAEEPDQRARGGLQGHYLLYYNKL